MKHLLILFLLLFFFNRLSGQSTDTLTVIILSPYRIEVANNYLPEYKKLGIELLTKRSVLKTDHAKQKLENIEAYNKQPDYVKQMFENEITFYDSLTIDNYLSMVVREYIAYRLYKPFKIKPRLVFVSTKKTSSNLTEYVKLTRNRKNLFIVNMPEIKVFKDSSQLKVLTQIELYSGQVDKILYSKQNTGIPKGGMTDYPMCSGDNWDCAFVNSVYPSLVDILKIIVANNTDKK